MKLDANARYSKTHEWARKEENLIVVGISDHAQNSLGDIVYVDLPKPGTSYKAGSVFGAIESVKAASDLYLPVSGTINTVNDTLASAPETVNKDCYGAGWIVKIEPAAETEYDALLSPEDYKKATEE
ncbi:MAG: glycine cleavage system protein GcvH [Treponema sp.]|jgi:glycine cleavage system H protein|nr:glycine cleavage system protein GcvH [Treponema sp.]